ncbi:cholinesterase [Hyaloscypha hepaticicola]|uniref:Cholinesterase n=1 Tax=Hyaloscypha hepaticicola TaxID=2082293 RepID=A0A2J6Q0C4_9HELO|nr:cholinesterase [Hyaloscypha hepaticicola]
MQMNILARFLCLLGASIALLPSASPHHAPPPPSATLDAGVIVGNTATALGSKVTVNQFLGVPFAAKPVRFGMPEPPTPWKHLLETTNQPPACPQQFNGQAIERNILIETFNTPPPPAGESEDCLYLNVYAPATLTKKKPVLFFLYGGSSQYGCNSIPRYDGTNFAANQEVIIVAPNYRTNVFGFSNSPQIPFDQLNVGYHDQRLALQWVQRNIHAFGGDPAAVTLWGWASGASCVDNLITTTPIDPPFRAAIMQSGQTGIFGHPTNATHAWDSLAQQLNCSAQPDVLECVRAANVTTIISILELSNLLFSPVKDNITDLLYPETALETGNVSHVPVLLGTTAQDGGVYVYGQDNTTAWLNAVLGSHPILFAEIEEEYAFGTTANGRPITDDSQQISAFYTDIVYQCVMAIRANESITGGIPTWRYLYNATFPNLQPYPGALVYHGSENFLIFGNLPANTTDSEVKFSKFMQKLWADHAKNPRVGPSWPQNPTIRTVSSIDIDTRCGFLEPYLAAAGGGG